MDYENETYESETCESCVWWRIWRSGASANCCVEMNATTPDPIDTCEHFTPSLECRKVRALEGLVPLVACVRWNPDGLGAWLVMK